MPQGTNSAELAATERLESWKEIATYLSCGERTAKRWEKTRNLPVRRLPGGRGQVFAFRSDIAAWRISNLSGTSLAGESGAAFVDEGDEADLVDRVQDELTASSPASIAAKRNFWLLKILLPVAGVAAVVLLVAVGLRMRSHAAAAATAEHVPPQRARDLYLAGRFYLNKRTPADLQQAITDFQASLAVDSAYAAPYAGLADAYGLSPEFASMASSQAYPKMLDAARHAIALDPNLAEGHSALGFALYYWNWDLPGARREFDRSIALNNRDATTFLWYANVLGEAGELPNALAMMDRARELDPTSPTILADRGLLLEGLGRDHEAVRDWTELENTDASYLPPHWYHAAAELKLGDAASYLAELKTIGGITHSAADAEHFEMCTHGYKIAGIAGLRNAEADFLVKQVQRGGPGNYLVAAEALTAVSRNEEALHYIDLAFRDRDSSFPALAHDDNFNSLENDPRFEDLKARSQLPYPDSASSKASQSTSP